MSNGWSAANRARSLSAEAKRTRLIAALPSSRTFREAAWRAGIPIRTAARLLPAADRA